MAKKKKETPERIDPFLELLKQTFPWMSWVAEYRFHETRKWRFDYCSPPYRVAIEQEGGLWINGRHNRAATMIKDFEKYNESAKQGYLLLKYTPQNITAAVDDIKEMMERGVI